MESYQPRILVSVPRLLAFGLAFAAAGEPDPASASGGRMARSSPEGGRWSAREVALRKHGKFGAVASDSSPAAGWEIRSKAAERQP